MVLQTFLLDVVRVIAANYLTIYPTIQAVSKCFPFSSFVGPFHFAVQMFHVFFLHVKNRKNRAEYLVFFRWHLAMFAILRTSIYLFSYSSIGSFRVNSTNGSQVSVSNIAQKIPKITLVSIMKACQILGCNSKYFWRYSLSNFLFCFAFLPSRL